MDKEKIVHASDITECEECPLYGHDCCGGWSSSGTGAPIEPPCTSWNGDEEIYEGMYDHDYRDYEYTEVSYKEKQVREQKAWEKQRKEYLERRIAEYSNYGNVKIKPVRLLDKWYCPRCRNWFYPNGCASPCRDRDGIETSICPICSTKLAYSYELADE